MAKWNRHGVARLKSALQSHVDAGRIPGAVALLAAGGQVECVEAFGRLAPDGAGMPADAIFRIYSMTKPIVSLATVMLIEEGLLQAGDPVSKYLPEFASPQVAVEEGGATRLVPAMREATVQDLLRHTAGLTYEFLGSNGVQRRYSEVDIDSRARTSREFCRVLASLPLQDPPGTCFQYSRATDVLGALVEVVAGRTLGEHLRERIFEPLGMKDTAFAVPAAQWHRIAEPFPIDPVAGQAVTMFAPREVPAFESGGGGLVGTVQDYARFLQLMRGRGSFGGTRLVGRKTIEWMTADHLGALPIHGDLLLPGYGFGLGFSVRRSVGLAPQPGSAGQYFWSGIGGTSFFVDPVEDVFAILMTQAPLQRIYFRNLFRNLVYAALD